MATPLEDKLDDLSRWTMLACEHHRSGRVEDALMNMRKAGEAAAKAIITSQWSGKRGTDAIAGVSFAGMIQLIIRNGLATKPTILLLQTLQVEGNSASHDNRLKRGRAELGMASLNELVHWLYEENLGRSLPDELRAAFKPVSAAQATAPKERRSSKADQRQEERIAELERRIVELNVGTSTRSRDDDATGKVLAELRQELALARAERAPQQEEPIPEAPHVATPRGRAWGIGIGVLAVAMLAGWLFLHRSSGRKAVVATEVVARADSATFTLVLVPLTILQDNPNIHIDLVASLNNRLQRRIAERPYAVRVIVDTTRRSATPTSGQAWELARTWHASLVLFGDLVEPTSSDSGTATLNYALRRRSDVVSGTIAPSRFRTMADPSVDRLMDECVWLFDLALANRLAAGGGYSPALEVLYAARSNTPEGELTRHVLMAQCHAALGNNAAALREAQWCLDHNPGDPETLAFLGTVYTGLGDRAKAAMVLEQAVAKAPKNADFRLGLANVLVDRDHPGSANNARAEALVQEAIKLDPDNATAWAYAAFAHMLKQEWTEAARCFERSLQLQPRNENTIVNLAQLEAFRLDKPEAAAERLTVAIGKDSADPHALFLLAEIYTRTSMKDPDAAQKLYAKANAKEPMAKYGAEIGQADAAYGAGDMKAALAHYTAAWAMDSTDPRIANQIANILIAGHRDARALQVLRQGLARDPANHMLNANIGQVLMAGPKDLRDLKAAERYLTTALATDPLDTLVLEQCGNVRVMLGDMQGAEKVLRMAYRLDPDGYGVNRGLGLIRDSENDLVQARMHYEKAIALKPKDDVVASNLAYVLLRTSPGLVLQGLYWAKRSVELERSPENLLMYSNLLQASGKYNEAADAYYEAIKDRPDLRQQDIEEVLNAKGLGRSN
ncbi:MAG: tetratricopeptide repeat protein [Flavobacteriales bacterium]|jgi:Flp pilus assembly protein TadD|nr:tetratricopeptide repeat protein [Flavobacteriales bacterium]MCB0758014.1 tetratricopeptide repeat protein [Flavobacteriales bacterium]